MAYIIRVYTSFEVVDKKKKAFSFNVQTRDQVTAHIKQLFLNGYRRVLSADTIEWYPPHVITRVEATGPGLEAGYNDNDITD